MIPETQRESWEKTQERLGDKQARVLQVIRDSRFGRTLFEVANVLGWPVNSVSGRVTELRKLGMVYDSRDRRINPETNKKAIVWLFDNRVKGQMELL